MKRKEDMIQLSNMQWLVLVLSIGLLKELLHMVSSFAWLLLYNFFLVIKTL